MDILWRSALGGLAIGLVMFLSRKFGSAVAGLFILFPVISLPTYYFIGTTEGMEKLRSSLLNSLAALPVWIAFVASFYLASQRFKLIPSILISLGVWILAAVIFLNTKKPT